MHFVESVDYVNKRVHLAAATVGTDLDTLDIYREMREMRRTNEDHRKFKPMVISGGNVVKIPGVSYTLPYVQLLYGCRLVPYDASHTLRLIRDTFTDDGSAGRDCFDRSSLSASVEVDIDVDIEKIEIRVVNTSSAMDGLTDMAESDKVFVPGATAGTGTLHYYKRGTTIDLIPPKSVTGSSQKQTAGLVQ
jgi:hypothetical protein